MVGMRVRGESIGRGMWLEAGRSCRWISDRGTTNETSTAASWQQTTRWATSLQASTCAFISPNSVQRALQEPTHPELTTKTFKINPKIDQTFSIFLRKPPLQPSPPNPPLPTPSTTSHLSPNSIRMPLPTTDQMIQIKRTHQTRMTLTQIRDPHERHSSRQLSPQNLNKVLDTFLAIVDGVQERPAHAYCCGAETERFQDVGAAAHAAVDVHLEAGED